MDQNDLFTADDTTVSFDQLVGEGKRYANGDILAKSKIEADKAIKLREQELAELRAELNTRLSLEEFLAKTSANVSTQGNNPPVEQTPQKVEATPSVSKDEVMNLVREALSTEKTKQTVSQNVDSVRSTLQKQWGNNWNKHLEDKVTELGIGKEFLSDIAGRSPQAALALLGVSSQENKKPTNPNAGMPPQSGMSALPSAGDDYTNGVRNRNYWEKLRASDPKTYHSKEKVLERYNDMMKLREAW